MPCRLSLRGHISRKSLHQVYASGRETPDLNPRPVATGKWDKLAPSCGITKNGPDGRYAPTPIGAVATTSNHSGFGSNYGAVEANIAAA